MKITLTGSLGHIGQPLATELSRLGHQLTIVSSNPNRQPAIEALGAEAAIGSIEDIKFLQDAFTGADIVYCMEPPTSFFDQGIDMTTQYKQTGDRFVQAIKRSGVKRIVHLSSIGAHRPDGVGMLSAHYQVEQSFRNLSSEIAINFMRPVGFYHNMYAYIPGIKANGVIRTNFGGNRPEPWVSTADIAAAIVREIQQALPAGTRKITYVASEEISPQDIAATLGAALNMPELRWELQSDKEQLDEYLSIGMNPVSAAGIVDMNASRMNGLLYEDYYQERPVLGNHKFESFAKEFAEIFHKD